MFVECQRLLILRRVVEEESLPFGRDTQDAVGEVTRVEKVGIQSEVQCPATGNAVFTSRKNRRRGSVGGESQNPRRPGIEHV